jgi:hypothetical protein
MLTLYLHRERFFDEIGKKREGDDSFQKGRMLGPSGTLNTTTPCAACKLLRRRCAQECPFSPYFSPHEPQKFASVHKVFGASNVSKLLMVYTHKNLSLLLQKFIYLVLNLRNFYYPNLDPMNSCVDWVNIVDPNRRESISYLVFDSAVDYFVHFIGGLRAFINCSLSQSQKSCG